jgi:hypothetical protein
MLVGGIELTSADVTWLEQEGRKRGRTRTTLARGLCERKGLVDGTGRLRVITARIDLSRHVRAGRLALPAAAHAGPPRRRPATAARQEDLAKAKAPKRPLVLAALGALTVHRIRGPADRWHAEWVRCLDEHHYLGSGPLCGAQVRYVVLARSRLVAAASFSSAALQVAARDEFIGWSAGARQRNRGLVIAQSRMCLAMQVPNLASRVQALLLRRVAADWEEVYGKRPVLVESYVDTARFKGTCYRAANWQLAGKTAGRGRQDRQHAAEVSLKAVWVYPLHRQWRELLCVEPVRKLDPAADWAETEWGTVELGDRRLTQRLLAYGRARFARPTANLPQACGSRAATKAAYRLLQHERANLQELLSCHREATLSRAASESVVLAIQDTTSLNYSTHRATAGLGPIASTGAEATLGLEVHSLMVANGAGTPLGLLDMQVWARDPKAYGQSKQRAQLPTKEKESQKWLNGYAVADAAAQRLASTQVVVVGDREADIYDLFQAAAAGRAQLLVRATQPRRILTPAGQVEGHLWDCVRKEPAATVMEVHVPRRGTRRARIAHVEVRYREVVICSPRKRGGKRGSVRIFAVAATEAAATAVANEAEPIEWLLLTTLPVTTAEQAVEKVRWYTQRWLIEIFHRTLKSGCGIENRQAKSESTLEAALAVDAVVAWRVMWLTKLGRETPDVPCSIFFEQEEWQALHCVVHQTKTPPREPPRLHDAMRMVAGLGGFLGRKSDGEPGTQTIWRGLERLMDFTIAFRMFFSSA